VIGICPEGLRKTTDNLCCDGRSLYPDLNPVPPDPEAGEPNTRLCNRGTYKLPRNFPEKLIVTQLISILRIRNRPFSQDPAIVAYLKPVESSIKCYFFEIRFDGILTSVTKSRKLPLSFRFPLKYMLLHPHPYYMFRHSSSFNLMSLMTFRKSKVLPWKVLEWLHNWQLLKKGSAPYVKSLFLVKHHAMKS
jgi:hypothetical protein